MSVWFRRQNRANRSHHHIIFARSTQILTKTKYHFTLIYCQCAFFSLSVLILLVFHSKTYFLFFFFVQIRINIYFISFVYFSYQNQFRVCSSPVCSQCHRIISHSIYSSYCVCMCLICKKYV